MLDAEESVARVQTLEQALAEVRAQIESVHSASSDIEPPTLTALLVTDGESN